MLRQGKCVLQGAHARVIGHEAFAIGIQIPEYPWSHQFNHDPSAAAQTAAPAPGKC